MRHSFLLRTLVNAGALWAATRLVSGVEFVGGWLPFLGVAIVFGVVNTFVGWTAKILALPLIVVTLGIFLLVINALMLMLTAWLVPGFHLIGSFWNTLLVAFFVSVLSVLLNLLFGLQRAR